MDIDFIYLYTNKNSILVSWESVDNILTEFLCDEDHVKEKNIKSVAQSINLVNQSESK